MTKKKLWMRKLACGHERSTDINYMMKVYTKPNIGDECYCRECGKTTKILNVKEVKR